MLSPEFLDAARALIAADSVTDRGNLAAVEVLEPLCRWAGLTPMRLPSATDPLIDANLLAGPGGGAGAQGAPLLLVTHLDTVDPGPIDLWRTDPFTLVVEGDRAFGRGAADVKLDALCKLWAAHSLKDVPLRRPFWFLGTFGEENGLRGARQFMQQPPFCPEYVLCGEPTSLGLCNAHKGYVVVRVRLELVDAVLVPIGTRHTAEVSGRAVHSSTPQLGENAIEKALETWRDRPGRLLSIHGGSGANVIPARCRADFADEESESRAGAAHAVDLRPLLADAAAVRAAWRESVAGLVPAEDARFDPPAALSNLNVIRSGHDWLELTLDARLLPAHAPDALLEEFSRRVGRALRTGTRLQVEVTRSAAGMDLAADSALVRTAGEVLQAHGCDPAPRAKPTSTEGGVFHRAGCQAAIFGASPSRGNAHAANEFALLPEVERSIGIYVALIRALCGEGAGAGPPSAARRA